MRRKTLIFRSLVAALPVLAGLAGCSSVPNLVDEKSLVAKCGEAFEEMKRSQKISKDPKLNAMMQRVCTRLTESLDFWAMPLAEWEFVVFDAPNTVNALAMPGGKIAVFSGTFDVAKTDDELAVVLGHEISHVTAKHVNKRFSREMLVQAGGTGLLIGTGGALTSLAVLTVYNYQTGTYGLSFDRGNETEADHIGLLYMARAGYNPRAAIDLWERMNSSPSGKEAPPEWLSTHPSNENRLARLYGWMTEAEAEYEKARAKTQ